MRSRQWSPVGWKPAGGRRLLVLGAGAGQLGLLAAARERGLFVTAVDRDPGAPGFRYADRRAIVSLDDEPALERLAEAGRVDGVIAPGSDWPVGAAARIAARFGLPHPISPAAAVLSSSRLRQRERLAEAGIPQTRWKVVTGPDDELGFPCVVKAPDRQAPRGLSLVRSREELGPAVTAALRASRNGLCLVEELAEGPEVRVTAFSLGGVFHPLTVTDGLPDAFVWPSDRPDRAIAMAERAAEALGIEEGPTSTRLLIEPGGRVLVTALAARLGGAHDAELCRAACGIDLNGLALSAALGEEIDPARLEQGPRAGGACVRFLRLPRRGQAEVEGIAEAERVEGVERVWVYRASDRGGAVLTTGANGLEARARAARAAECIRFRPVDAEAVA
jgi:biotin carboxylase